MTSLTTALSEAELDRLSEFLDTLSSPDAMNIERMDGFLCALIIGPELVMPSEYWPCIVGSDEDESNPVFESIDEAQTIMTLVMRHWNTIAGTLQADDIYLPMLLEDDDGLCRGNDWAKGFMDGVELRRPSWRSFIEDEEHAGAIVPMMALAHEDHPDPELRFESPAPEKRVELLQLMTAGIVQMYRYFEPMRAAQSAQSRQPFVRSQPKIGRNEPRPCGSGQQYKQCCMTRMH